MINFPQKFSWFNLAMTGIFFICLSLRFWRLTQFNTLVFDEVYYAKFGNNYLTGTDFFNSHPPVSQYIIAIGIWLGSFFPASLDTINDLTGSLRSTFSYRWFNALTGSFIPLIVASIAYQLTRSQIYSLISAIFISLDGLFLVQSRYALSDIYIVFFGLLGHLFFFLALKNERNKRWLKLTLSGFFFGTSVATKWNGLGYLLGIYLLWLILYFLPKPERKKSEHILIKLARFKPIDVIIYLCILPLVTYCLLWIPHLIMNPQYGFLEVHQKILLFHEKLGANVHPYCSSWFSWLIMWRPIAFFYETALNLQDIVPAYPPLPRGVGKIIYDVHALGNPFLWWLSTTAVLILLLALFIRVFSTKYYSQQWSNSVLVAVYLVVNYCANFLPWLKVQRCIFIYHYLPALGFSFLASAWLVYLLIKSNNIIHQRLGISLIVIVVLAFIFWSPIYFGLPLSVQDYHLRMWFNSWY